MSVTSKGTKEVISEAKSMLAVGQHWRLKAKGKSWPLSVVVVAIRDFSSSGVQTMVVEPVRQAGLSFPVRADVLTDNYKLVHCPATLTGTVWEELTDYEEALVAISESESNDPKVLKAQAELALKGTKDS